MMLRLRGVLGLAAACSLAVASSLGCGSSPAASTSSSGGGGDGGGAACAATPSTAGVECSYSHDALNSSPSVNMNSTVTWSCSGTTRLMASNGVPDHATGTFPNSNCPNTISAWSAQATFPLEPTVASSIDTSVQIIGFALNGVKFDPSTAGTCTVSGSTTTCSLIGDTGSWNIEALGQSSFDFGVDDNNAHVQPSGEYHYHGMPTGVVDEFGHGTAKPSLVGFALDGFPLYARYGYATANDASSPLKVMKSSYELKTTPDSGRPSTSTYPMGAFTQDYEYVAGSGDLDECNGRTDVTPEFPCGIYHYYITDTYPFIQRCLKGTALGGTEESGGGGGTMMAARSDAGSCSSSSECSSGDVCCPAGIGCAGQCVPDCRSEPSGCGSGLTCDTSSGVCTP